MDINSVFFLLSILGVIQGLYISFLFFVRPGKIPVLSNLLSVLFFLGAAVMFMVTLVNAHLITEYPVITILEYFITLIIGPILALY